MSNDIKIVGWGLMQVDEDEPCFFDCGKPLNESDVYITYDDMEMYPAHQACIPEGTVDLIADHINLITDRLK